MYGIQGRGFWFNTAVLEHPISCSGWRFRASTSSSSSSVQLVDGFLSHSPHPSVTMWIRYGWWLPLIFPAYSNTRSWTVTTARPQMMVEGVFGLQPSHDLLQLFLDLALDMAIASSLQHWELWRVIKWDFPSIDSCLVFKPQMGIFPNCRITWCKRILLW